MDAADFYSGIVADAYPKLKSTSFDSQRYADFVRSWGEPGLEIGCGDGEPLLALCAAGLDVDGIDSSLDMVQRCRANAHEVGLNVSVHHQRVEQLDLQRRYASIYFAGPTFNLLPDDARSLQALAAIRDHLAEDGAALIPLWIPGPTPTDQLGRWREADDDHGTRLRHLAQSETYDRENRTRATASRYERVTTDGTEYVEREWIIHWQTPQSFTELCADAGLTVKDLPDDEAGVAATEESVHFTATVQRA